MWILIEHVCIAPYFILIGITLWVRKLRFTKVNIIVCTGMDYLLCDQAGLRILSEKYKSFHLENFLRIHLRSKNVGMDSQWLWRDQPYFWIKRRLWNRLSKFFMKKDNHFTLLGNSLSVQLLEFHAFTAQGLGSTLNQRDAAKEKKEKNNLSF